MKPQHTLFMGTIGLACVMLVLPDVGLDRVARGNAGTSSCACGIASLGLVSGLYRDSGVCVDSPLCMTTTTRRAHPNPMASTVTQWVRSWYTVAVSWTNT